MARFRDEVVTAGSLGDTDYIFSSALLYFRLNCYPFRLSNLSLQPYDDNERAKKRLPPPAWVVVISRSSISLSDLFFRGLKKGNMIGYEVHVLEIYRDTTMDLMCPLLEPLDLRPPWMSDF